MKVASVYGTLMTNHVQIDNTWMKREYPRKDICPNWYDTQFSVIRFS